jgi:hypothetical protein
VYSISSKSCYNTLIRYWTYTNGAYKNYYDTYTNITVFSYTIISINLYYSTTQSYTATPIYSKYTLTNTIVPVYTFSSIKTIIDILNDIDTMTNYETYVQYSTITRIIYSSESQLRKDETSGITQSCNNIELFILLYSLFYK